MKIPLTLALYIGRQFLIAIAVTFMALWLLIFLIEMMELLRRTGDHSVPFNVLLEMSFLRLPVMGARVLPFAVLIGGMMALARLTRTSELAVARAAGISVWQFLAPAVALAFLIGAVFVAVINPISAAMLARFDVIEGRYITDRPSLLSVSASGLWLRQVEDKEPPLKEYILHALRLSQANMEVSNVMVLLYADHNKFLGRLDAQSAALRPGQWQLNNVIYSVEGKPPVNYPVYTLATDLTPAEIENSFAPPETLSFWQLPGFISILEKAGFSGLSHRIHWQSLMASPFLLVAMILVGAVFSLRLPRRGGVSILIVAGITTGFILHFLSNLVMALGQAGSLPVELAAWAPALVSLMAGAGLLLHFEDG